MQNKDYREIQLSSAQLTLIFVGILALGAVIFLLGVSVGKKQAQLTQETEIAAPLKAEQVEERPVVPAPEPKDVISQELASHQKIKEEKQKKPPAVPSRNLYYIQVAALNNREAALSFAEEFKKKGYPATVLDPIPTDKKAIFRVRIGSYPTREEAEEVLARLRAETKRKTDYFIIRS